MWFKKKIPLQSDILIFLSILHVCFSAPEITIQVDNTTGVTSQSIYVEWKVCFVKNNEKCGEDILSNQGDLRCFRFVCIPQALMYCNSLVWWLKKIDIILNVTFA